VRGSRSGLPVITIYFLLNYNQNVIETGMFDRAENHFLLGYMSSASKRAARCAPRGSTGK